MAQALTSRLGGVAAYLGIAQLSLQRDQIAIEGPVPADQRDQMSVVRLQGPGDLQEPAAGFVHVRAQRRIDPVGQRDAAVLIDHLAGELDIGPVSWT